MGDLRICSLQTPAMMEVESGCRRDLRVMMRPVESGCRRLAWAVLWAPRRSPRPDMFQPLCSDVGARTVDGLPTQPEAVLGRRGLPARLLSRRCVPRAACVALRGPLLPRPRRRSPSPCAAGSLRLAISCAPRLRRAALRPGPCWASRPTRRAYAGSSSAALAALSLIHI